MGIFQTNRALEAYIKDYATAIPGPAGGGSTPFSNTYSLEFDGVNEYLTTPAKVNLGVNSTISYWFKGGANANNTLLGEDDNQFDYVIQIATGTNQVAFRVGTKYSTWVGVTELSDNAWHHYAFVRSSTSADLYVDGSLKTKTVVGVYDGTATTFHVLGAQGNFALPIDGFIDEFSGWNSALSSDDIAIISSAPKNLKGLLASNPIVWWRNGDGTALFRNAEWDIPNEMASDYFSQYSMEFDGVNDAVRVGPAATSLGISGAISISMWCKMPAGTVTVGPALGGEDSTGGATRNWGFLLVFNKLYFEHFNTDGTKTQCIDPTASTIQDGDWHHVMGTYSGTNDTNGLKLYIDGLLVNQKTTGSTGTRTAAQSFFIGAQGATGTSYNWEGEIDDVAVFNTDKSGSIATIYNSGVPTDLSEESGLYGYWRMGEGSYWNATNWQLPDYSKKDLFSQKSLEFDGVNDSVGIGATSLGITSAISISAWVKTTATGAYRVIAAEDTTSGSNRNWLLVLDSSNKVAWYLWNTDGTSSSVIRTAANEITDGAWHHILATYDGSTEVDGIKLYVDGVVKNGTAGSTGIRSSATTEPAIGSLTAAANWFWSGNIDDVAIFNNDQSSNISTIYNSGVPTDLSGESGLVGYWIFDDATFSTNWTVPDNSTNSNTGTSANMDEVDLTLDTPTNLYSAISQNMDEEDKVLDAPSNENGMTSVNMEEDSRTTDVPT